MIAFAIALNTGFAVDKVLFENLGARVKGLVYDESARMFLDSTTGSQYATFGLSLTSTAAPEGYSGPHTFTWSNAKPYSTTPLIEGLLTVAGPVTGPTALGEAFGPGVFSVTCTVEYHKLSDQSILNRVYSGNCAAIGGPIQVGIRGGTSSLPT